MKKKIVAAIAVIIMTISFLNAQEFEHFITVDGHKLMDGNTQFRFLSFNIPNLNFIEDELDFQTVYPYRLPTEYEIRDALLSIKEMGGQVVRIYTLPVRNLNFPDSIPAHVTGPGEFNEKAFIVNDMMLAIANELGIRIIFPLLNEWKWLGGKPQYAAFRGLDESEFYTNRQLIDDFKKTVEFTLNRTNTITGIKYKNDKAILCWETGNELLCPHEWTVEITQYIKSLDKNHLVLDGYHAFDSRPVREESVLEPSVDIIHSHHYEVNPMELYENINHNLEIIDGRKPYIIGEFGFQSTTALEQVVNKLINTPEIAGGLIWSLRSHREEGGFYWHSEPMGLGIYKAYHWPGFTSGNSYDEKDFLQMYRQKAHEIRGKNTPAVSTPQAPELLPIKSVYNINWKGSVGAAGYIIERTETETGPWITVGYNISDAATPYFSLFHDVSAKKGASYYYRVTAQNASGSSEPSNIYGPVQVTTQAIIDNMTNYGKVFDSKVATLTTDNDRKYKEKIYRMKGQYGSELLYKLEEPLKQFKVYSFELVDLEALRFYVSRNGKDYKQIKTETSWHHQPGNSYGYNYPVSYFKEINDEVTYFLKIEYLREAEIGRVELIY